MTTNVLFDLSFGAQRRNGWATTQCLNAAPASPRRCGAQCTPVQRPLRTYRTNDLHGVRQEGRMRGALCLVITHVAPFVPPFPLDRLSAVAAGRRRTRSTTMVAAATALTRSTTTLAAAAAYDYGGGGCARRRWWRRLANPATQLRVTPLPGTVPSLKRTVDAEAVTRAITTRLDCVALRSGCPVGAPVRLGSGAPSSAGSVNLTNDKRQRHR